MTRRTVRFQDLDAVVQQAEQLLAEGYTREGKWSLGQMSEHLALAIERSMDGFPSLMPAPVRWLVRWLALGKVLRHERIHRAVPAPKYLMPADQVEDQAGVNRLRAAVARFQRHPGPWHPSPIFGELTPDQWREVHLWHSEHHLSFLQPRSG